MSHLIHAHASKYYDPVKAHEYYMKNRELKGRSTTELNKRAKLFGELQNPTFKPIRKPLWMKRVQLIIQK